MLRCTAITNFRRLNYAVSAVRDVFQIAIRSAYVVLWCTAVTSLRWLDNSVSAIWNIF